MADKNQSGASRQPSRLVREIRGYAEALIIAFLVVTFIVNTVGVVGSSMRPTFDGGRGQSHLLESLFSGDRVLVSKYHNWLVRLGILDDYRAGTVIVHRSPTSSYDYQLNKANGCFESLLFNRCRPFLIKRVAAAPGDTFSIDAGQLILNGQPVDQSFITEGGIVDVEPVNFPVVLVDDAGVLHLQVDLMPYQGVNIPRTPTEARPTGFVPVTDPRVQAAYGSIIPHINVPPDAGAGEAVLASITVPEGNYFVMGDNRSAGGSLDSRVYGFIRAIDVSGPASVVIWPPRRDGEWNWRLIDHAGYPDRAGLADQVWLSTAD